MQVKNICNIINYGQCTINVQIFRLSLVESIPEGLVYSNHSIIYSSTFDTWLELINGATESIDIASLYWTMRQSEVYPDPSSLKVEFNAY